MPKPFLLDEITSEPSLFLPGLSGIAGYTLGKGVEGGLTVPEGSLRHVLLRWAFLVCYVTEISLQTWDISLMIPISEGKKSEVRGKAGINPKSTFLQSLCLYHGSTSWEDFCLDASTKELCPSPPANLPNSAFLIMQLFPIASGVNPHFVCSGSWLNPLTPHRLITCQQLS